VGEPESFEAFDAATYRRVVGQVFALLGDLQGSRGRDPGRLRQGLVPLAAVSPDRIDLHRALGRLAPLHREVLFLHYVAKLSVDEVARQLRLPAGTVKSRLSRARRALAEQLGDERGGGQCMTTR
jgi:hypothetical protein